MFNCAWVSSESRSTSQNYSPNCARMLPQTCSVLDIPWNVRGAKMAPLCSRTGHVGPVPKGRWRLSSTNRRYGRNMGSLIWNKIGTPIKRMEASRFTSSKESAPNTICCEDDVHWSVRHWWDNTALRCTSKADGKRCPLLHSTIFFQRSGENDDIWWYRTSSFLMTMQAGTPLLLSRTSCAAGNGRFCNIHCTHPIWIHAITIFSPKRNNHCEGLCTIQEMNLSML